VSGTVISILRRICVLQIDAKEPAIGDDTYVSETATIIGDVRIGSRCYIGHGAILRGDYGTVIIGDKSAVEEGVIIHAPPDDRCMIGSGVVMGHGAVIHAKAIGDSAGIGMGAILSIRSEIGAGSVVAEGAVVKQSQVIPDSIVVAGNPAKKIKEMTEKDVDFWKRSRQIYVDLAAKYCRLGMECI
jgi:carbonic anhydrase/acetyltransferase-like protein (isoleucine patch superfamily)